MRHKRQPPGPDDSLREHVESSLTQLQHQIWLIRNVFWWYILPPAISMLAFFSHIAWQARSGGWLTALCMAAVLAIVFGALAACYWFNQKAVRIQFEPRRRELETLLASLSDEPPVSS